MGVGQQLYGLLHMWQGRRRRRAVAAAAAARLSALRRSGACGSSRTLMVQQHDWLLLGHPVVASGSAAQRSALQHQWLPLIHGFRLLLITVPVLNCSHRVLIGLFGKEHRQPSQTQTEPLLRHSFPHCTASKTPEPIAESSSTAVRDFVRNIPSRTARARPRWSSHTAGVSNRAMGAGLIRAALQPRSSHATAAGSAGTSPSAA